MLCYFTNIKYKEIIDAYNNENNQEYERGLLNFALKFGLSGDIWKKYLLYTLIYNDNNYTRAIELTSFFVVPGLKNDMEYFYDLYYKETFKLDIEPKNTYLNKVIDSLYDDLAIHSSLDSFTKIILNFYKNFGIGDMALFKAFRTNNGVLEPIESVIENSFDDIIGYDYQKKLLIENTLNFIEGKSYNNVLLYGDSGTGKSTSIKALLNTFFDKGLRIIEVYKHQMEEISKIIRDLKNRPYHFIIYMDDLSFEENEIEYKYLKSVIEGGIEEKPKNVCIYATSNRRHLIKEVSADNKLDDLHRNETQAEKLSLAYRFGLQIFYSSLNPIEFKNMVLRLAKKNNLTIDENVLLLEANKWEIQHGNLSGRCAQQFINYISKKDI